MKNFKNIIKVVFVVMLLSVGITAYSIEGKTVKDFGFDVIMYDNDPIIVGFIQDSPTDKNFKNISMINKVNKKNVSLYSRMSQYRRILENIDSDVVTFNITRNGKKEDITLTKDDIFVSDYIKLSDFVYLNKNIKTDGAYAYVWDKAIKTKDFPISNVPNATYIKTESKIDCTEKKILDLKQLYYGENDVFLKEEKFSEYAPMESVAPDTIGADKVYYACLKYETQKYDREHPNWFE